MLDIVLLLSNVALDGNIVGIERQDANSERNQTTEAILDEIKTYKDAYFGVAMACGTVLLIFFIGCLLKIYSSYIDSILQPDNVSMFIT